MEYSDHSTSDWPTERHTSEKGKHAESSQLTLKKRNHSSKSKNDHSSHLRQAANSYSQPETKHPEYKTENGFPSRINITEWKEKKMHLRKTFLSYIMCGNSTYQKEFHKLCQGSLGELLPGNFWLQEVCDLRSKKIDHCCIRKNFTFA